jgi:hypothetical protein
MNKSVSTNNLEDIYQKPIQNNTGEIIANSIEITQKTSCGGFFFGMSPTDAIHCLIPDSEKRNNLEKSMTDYDKKDNIFLYFVTLVSIGTFISSMFSFVALNDCDVKTSTVKNLTLWMSSFSIFCCGIRIYFQREYILMPIVVQFQSQINDNIHKFMNVFLVILACSLAGNLTAVWALSSNDKQRNAVIAMCILIAMSLLTSFWFKLIVRRVTFYAVSTYCKTQYQKNEYV